VWPLTPAAYSRATGLNHHATYEAVIGGDPRVVAASLAANLSQMPCAAATRWAAIAR
jgi:hypothetical protein